jgi:peptide chain release factor subunit 1
MTTSVRSLPTLLRELQEAASPTGRVLSVYLNTSLASTAGEGYLLTYRNGTRALRDELELNERQAFEAAARQAERYLMDRLVPGHPGLAMFASGGPDFFYAVDLPAAPREDVAWGESPLIEPLGAVLDEFERVAVLLFDKERARLFTLVLGEIEERHAIQDDVPGKQATGGWFALSQARFARHHEDHVLRHARRTVALLLTVLRTHPFDRLFLAGPVEAISLLKQQLPRPLRSRLVGQLVLPVFAEEEAVRSEALKAAERIERRFEAELVDELFEAAAAPHTAIGVDDTLAAVSAGRAHMVLVADSFRAAGVECPDCGRLALAVERCPSCNLPATHQPDLRERLVHRAREGGARVEIVRDEAGSRLLERGGLGAWTRY